MDKLGIDIGGTKINIGLLDEKIIYRVILPENTDVNTYAFNIET